MKTMKKYYLLPSQCSKIPVKSNLSRQKLTRSLRNPHLSKRIFKTTFKMKKKWVKIVIMVISLETKIGLKIYHYAARMSKMFKKTKNLFKEASLSSKGRRLCSSKMTSNATYSTPLKMTIILTCQCSWTTHGCIKGLIKTKAHL